MAEAEVGRQRFEVAAVAREPGNAQHGRPRCIRSRTVLAVIERKSIARLVEVLCVQRRPHERRRLRAAGRLSARARVLAAQLALEDLTVRIARQAIAECNAGDALL